MLAERTGRFYEQPMTAGRVYLIAGNGSYGLSGLGGPALKAAVTPFGLAVDHHGNIVISDNPDSCLAVVAASTGTFYGQKMTTGHIYRISRGNSVGEPGGVTVDAAGNAVVANQDASRVSVVAGRTGTYYGQKMTAGHLYSIAGDGSYADSGDGGPALLAGVKPVSVAVDPAGNVVIGDGGPFIRVVAARTGTFYGQKMTAGDICRIAGGGTRGLGERAGPAGRVHLPDRGRGRQVRGRLLRGRHPRPGDHAVLTSGPRVSGLAGCSSRSRPGWRRRPRPVRRSPGCRTAPRRPPCPRPVRCSRMRPRPRPVPGSGRRRTA